ncbi:hypothetical protein PG985_009544 [Apiospora marii]|uniref:Uncharacterized protein n=1 Tax=Apiospora marii TaxID=335849 RepID=A0ABR1RFL9_9PEZI
MTPFFAGVASGLLLVALQAHPTLALAASTTSEYVVVTTTHAYLGDVITTTRTIKTWLTPTARPTASSTYTNEYLDLEVIQLYLPTGSVGEWQLSDDPPLSLEPDDSGETRTYWVAPVTYTAPRSCPTSFEIQTTETVSVPAAKTAGLQPTATETNSGLWGASETLYLEALPPGVTPGYGYNYRHHIRACEAPSYSADGRITSWYRVGDAADAEVCVHRRLAYLCMSWRDWVIVLASVLPGLFVLGFLESFLWFRQMMRGRRALRLGTVSWTLISGWVACFIRVSPARDAGEQAALVAQWKALSAGRRWRLWWRWGFRHKYPVEMLGPDPRKMQMVAADAAAGEGGGVPSAKGEAQEGGAQKPEVAQQVQQVEGSTPAAPKASWTRFLPKIM